jgi:hypothetical protein
MNKVHLLKFSLILAIMGMMSSSCSQKEYAVKNRIDTLEYNGKEKYRPKQEYLDYTYHTFQTKDDCRSYVKEIGEGTPIVFLHGGWGHNLAT